MRLEYPLQISSSIRLEYLYKKYLLKNWNILYNPQHERMRLECPLLLVFDGIQYLSCSNKDFTYLLTILALTKDCNNNQMVNIVHVRSPTPTPTAWLR